MPPVNRLIPYLRQIDATRQYTNWGPLTSELERRLCAHWQMRHGAVTSAASGTAALVGAILGVAGRGASRPLAIIPAFTFVATAVAVEHAGYEPRLIDVDRDSWQLDPLRVLADRALDRVGLVVPVAPFGKPVQQQSWREFIGTTGIPVVIDGAASFDTVSADPGAYLGEIPVTMSFHATKSFAAGEGGAVITTDPAAEKRVVQALNFGFYGSRSSDSASSNGKMSEYHAAVALAELDGWAQKSADFAALSDRYRRQLSGAGLSGRVIAWPEISGCYTLFACRTAEESVRIQDRLHRARVEFRMWYGNGLHDQPYFGRYAKGPLPVTEDLARRLIGLPVAIDLSDDEVRRVADALVQEASRA